MQKSEWTIALQKIKEAGTLTQLPLGWDEEETVHFSHRKNRPDRYCHTCVTGAYRAAFLMDTVCSLATAYEGKARFLVLSPRREYASLLSVKGADIIVPYIGQQAQFEKMVAYALAEAGLTILVCVEI